MVSVFSNFSVKPNAKRLKITRITGTFFILILLNINALAQSDTTNKQLEKTALSAINTSGIPLVKNTKLKNPRKASLLSAVLPGAGQFYNGKYWKIPILWGGAYALGYFINLNHEQYILTRDSYLMQTSGQRDYFNNVYRPDQLVRLREYWRRNRDLLIIISAFGYLLNIADAAVDAHLSGFEVTDDISLRLEPQLQLAAGQPTFGIRMAFTLR